VDAKAEGYQNTLSARFFLKGKGKDKRESRVLVEKVKQIQEENGKQA
jgi:hypothetical protein